MTKIIHAIRNYLGREKFVFKELCNEHRLIHKYNATFGMLEDKQKLEARIEIGIHGVEKGLSFRNPKKAFGVEKIIFLLDNLLFYKEKFRDIHFIGKQLETIQAYIEFNKGYENKITTIVDKFNNLTKESSFHFPSGTINIKKEDIISSLDFNYEKFVNSRHSFRYFSEQPVDMSLLDKALKIAQQTPTACNRQPQKAYIFLGEKKNKLLKRQGGSKGFYEEINVAILITVEQKKYFMNEMHQCYVDGGLYAMGLLHALHYMGLATIPLTVGHYTGKDRNILFKDFNIDESEAPVLIIGVGNMCEQANVNKSQRKDFHEITTIIQ